MKTYVRFKLPEGSRSAFSTSISSLDRLKVTKVSRINIKIGTDRYQWNTGS